MKRIIDLGIVFVIFGFGLIIASFIPTVSSEIWLNESFSVPALNYYYYYADYPYFSSGINLHMSFSVSASSDNEFSFFILDENNFQKMEMAQTFDSYFARDRILSLNADITPPDNEKVYFVWDNSFGYTDRIVTANFSMEVPGNYIPSELSFFSFIFIFSGFALIGYGKRPVDEVPDSTSTKIGYILAVLGGVIGVIIGIGLLLGKNPNEKYHGKIITVIGLASIFVYIVIPRIQGIF